MRTVVITGAAGGIGMAAALAFVDAGWKAVGIDIKEPQTCRGDITFLKADVASPESIADVFARIEALCGHIDALVNNAAVQICKPLIEMSVEEWDVLMAVNLRSVFLCVRAAYPLLRKPGGAVVNVASVHAAATSRNIAAYAASKGGMLALTRALALEFAGDGIRVNAVLPGAVDTAMLRGGLNRGHLSGGDMNEKLRTLGSKTPLGRVGAPDEIARAILFLADGGVSSFITGEGLVVDGGALARLSTE